MVTEEQFTAAVGRPPTHDDLERCNCDKEGDVGHIQCGWCQTHELPVFICNCWFRRIK